MKGITGWDYHPFIPANRRTTQKSSPYVCRIAPNETGAVIEILDNAAPEEYHVLNYRIRGTDHPMRKILFSGSVLSIEGLQPYCDYEFFVERKNAPDYRSALRLFRTGFYPDIMVNYLHPEDNVYAFSGHYLCDPTFVRVPSGGLVAAMNLFAGGAAQDLEILFRSDDNGKTWHYLCDLFPAFFGTLFMHRNVLYMLATSTENGSLLIGASYDEGVTWTKPVLLFAGGNSASLGYQRQPMPILNHHGRLITSIDFGSWKPNEGYRIGVLSVSEDADLLESENWTVSDFTAYDPSWPGSPVGGNITILEGSIFVAGDGKLVNLARMQLDKGSVPAYGKACVLEIDENDLEAAPKFHSIIDMPTGANSRTHVLMDPETGKYWAIGNLVTDDDPYSKRSRLALSVSEDGYHWRVAKVLLDYSHLNPEEVGFQYTSFIFDGEDILYLTRTSFNGADSFHNANCQTFGVVEDFRKLL